MIVFFSILNSTTNCDMVCRNDEHCRVWAKLEVVCVGPGDIAICLFQNSKPTSGTSGKCKCVSPQKVQNIGGL
ncbi:hypothetical protein P8452_50612 [Trifolium repens]|nr:hypothetical protein P8452_50612 [Trifolium repens]